MLPEQHDILFSFLSIIFAVFGVYVFGNVIQHCRERGGLNTPLWGGIFGIFAITCFMMTVHMLQFKTPPIIKIGTIQSMLHSTLEEPLEFLLVVAGYTN